MVTIIVIRQFIQTFIVCLVESLSQSFHVGLHRSDQLRLANAANGRIAIEHTDIINIVQFAEDAELREFGDAGDENELQIRVELLERTVEVLHNEAKLRKVFLLVNHIEQRGIVFVYDDNHFFAGLLKCTFYDTG